LVANNDFPSTNGIVHAIRGTADNKTIVGGAFTLIGSQSRPYLARINSDGSVDDSFTPNVNFIVNALAVQPDGKIIIGGEFTRVNGVIRQRMARLNVDGSVDASFNAAFSAGVLSLAIQEDGKIWVGGSFRKVNGSARQGIVRLNSDGSLDGYTAEASGGAVMAIAVQDNGAIVIGGKFSSLMHSNTYYERLKIARINADGGVDISFNPRVLGKGVFALGLLKGKIVVGGLFSEIGGLPRQNIAHLSTSGSAFTDHRVSVRHGAVYSIVVDTEYSYVMSGNFKEVIDYSGSEGSRLTNIARILANVSAGNYTRDKIDECFAQRVNDGIVYAMDVDASKNILIGGQFSSLNTSSQHNLARLYACQNTSNYKKDTSFTNAESMLQHESINDFVVQEDNKIVIVGAFTSINGIARNRVARLLPDGRLDMSFELDFSGTDVQYLCSSRFFKHGEQRRNDSGSGR